MNILNGAIKTACLFLAIMGMCACTEKRMAETPMSVKFAQPSKTAKPGAAIKLVSESLIFILPNQLTQTTLVLASMEEQEGNLSVQLSPSEGLSLENTAIHQLVKNVHATSINIPITLMATHNGRYYLNMRIRVNDDEGVAVRNLAVIVQVGPLVNNGFQFKKTAGENIIVLPAQETFSTP